ncbi:MAG: CpsD/CapB family tyrosine-protein kinase [Deltaproteobacteria bacterium]|jgi:Mrp family chromosome partitioning ATPase|nr:CpsD/CapB family tyrosine-protein kinase [Deltaproteobacteria bacterium]
MAKTFEALQRAEREYQALRQPRAAVPQVSASSKIVSVVSPGGWHKLHYELSARNPDQPLRRIMFTGVGFGVGVTHSVIQFARAMSSVSGRKVLLVDANLKTPKLDRIFNIRPNVGFTDLLAPNGTKVFNIVKPGKNDLYAFPCGRFYPAGVCDFKSGRLNSLFKMAGEKFDYTVLDSAPVTKSSESRSLCSRVDGVLLVVDAGKTNGQLVAAAKKEIEAAGGRLLGVVLNKR